MRTLLFRSLFARPVTTEAPARDADAAAQEFGRALAERARVLFGRSLAIREIDAGSCNGCELEINALNNAVYDVERFGIRFVASPRHADVLLITGPVTHNMKVALERTYAATPDPKWVVAAGDCALGCGAFEGSYAVVGGGVGTVVPVDLRIPGCPPRPVDLVRGLLTLLDRVAPSSSLGFTMRRAPKGEAIAQERKGVDSASSEERSDGEGREAALGLQPQGRRGQAAAPEGFGRK